MCMFHMQFKLRCKEKSRAFKNQIDTTIQDGKGEQCKQKIKEKDERLTMVDNYQKVKQIDEFIINYLIFLPQMLSAKTTK